jgi:hypothetical protein
MITFTLNQYTGDEQKRNDALVPEGNRRPENID